MEANPAEKPLKILMVAAEVAPFMVVGGLAFVASALPRALHQLGHDVRVVMPRYAGVDAARQPLTRRVRDLRVPYGATARRVDVWEAALAPDTPAPVYLVDHPPSFDRPEVYEYPDDARRFLLFSRAALEMLPALDWWPDIVHCNDWHTGLIPNWLPTLYHDRPAYARLTSVFTIHNLFHQGTAPLATLRAAGLAAAGPTPIEVAAFPGEMNFLARGLQYAAAITTVSPQYAREILTPQYGEGLDPLLRQRQAALFGILNGIDMQGRDPATSPYLPAHFDATHLERRAANKQAFQREVGLPERGTVPLLAASSRLMPQKGFDIMVPALERLLGQQDVQFVMAGSGKAEYVALLEALQARFPARMAYCPNPDPGLIERLYAGSDIYLMPSRFEPCGLGQMFAMRYGSVPVVHWTGGLVDTVQDYDDASGAGNGFVFTEYTAAALQRAVTRALRVYADRPAWDALIRHDLGLDWSWDRSARRYVEIYRRARTL
ncbi:MAG TPA: glycogen/starch synthase [Chloroflexia bacterium]|nr:glycogen/starch synthase [Chloroflexia bacterium]